jgi:hypothetical protein
MLHALSFEVLLHPFHRRQCLPLHRLDLRLIGLQILSVLSTSIGIVPPSLLQALAASHPDHEVWLQSYYKEKNGIESLSTFNVLLWVNTKLCTRKVPQRPS